MVDLSRNALQAQIQQAIASQLNDTQLCHKLEELARHSHFPGLTCFWGPILYQRNRVVFRNLITNHFSQFTHTGFRWKSIRWKDHAQSLDSWLTSARTNRDTGLVKRLLRWKYASRTLGIDPVAWSQALTHDYSRTTSASARALVLEEYETWFQLDQPTALLLYQTDRNSSSFIISHLPRSFWDSTKRTLWTQLSSLAQSQGDEALCHELYRLQVPIKQWSSDVLALCRTIQDPHKLCLELERKHPTGYGLDLSATALQLLETRGRDVMPYIQRKLKDFLGGWYGDKVKPFTQLAAANQWWDLWSAVIRTATHDKYFNTAVKELLADDNTLSIKIRRQRLMLLAGVSGEWNWAGFGLARVHALDGPIANKLYQTFPDLVHGPFKPHVTPTWWKAYPELVSAAIAKQDFELVDLLASRMVTRPIHPNQAANKQEKVNAEIIETLYEHYQQLRTSNDIEYSRRVANVLTRIPSFAIYNYDFLLSTNKLARLMFARSLGDYLEAPQHLPDLVEASEIHVQQLAYRVLAQKDPRARRAAVLSLDVLVGTLLRPLHRKTRIAAFDALNNAAMNDVSTASLVLCRARDALRLPDRKYPKEQLIGLIAKILYCHPDLQTERERPVIYGMPGDARSGLISTGNTTTTGNTATGNIAPETTA